MTSDELEIVRFALALHLETDPRGIESGQRLEEDLGLDPLDLVLVVLRVEELGDVPRPAFDGSAATIAQSRVEFPVADLEGLRTVGDLVELVERWARSESSRLSDREHLRRAPTHSPAAHESGFHAITGTARARLCGVG